MLVIWVVRARGVSYSDSDKHGDPQAWRVATGRFGSCMPAEDILAEKDINKYTLYRWNTSPTGPPFTASPSVTVPLGTTAVCGTVSDCSSVAVLGWTHQCLCHSQAWMDATFTKIPVPELEICKFHKWRHLCGSFWTWDWYSCSGWKTIGQCIRPWISIFLTSV